MRSLNRSDLILLVVLLAVAVLVSLPFPFYPRTWHKLMHVVGAILFIGNIVVTAAWMILAVRTKQPTVAHFGARALMQADFLFTLPGILLIFRNGLVLAPAVGGGNVLGASWVVAGLALLILSGLVWAGFLLRYQSQLAELSVSSDQLSSEFMSVFRKWGIWGGIAVALPLIALLLMVFRPALWG